MRCCACPATAPTPAAQGELAAVGSAAAGAAAPVPDGSSTQRPQPARKGFISQPTSGSECMQHGGQPDECIMLFSSQLLTDGIWGLISLPSSSSCRTKGVGITRQQRVMSSLFYQSQCRRRCRHRCPTCTAARRAPGRGADLQHPPSALHDIVRRPSPALHASAGQPTQEAPRSAPLRLPSLTSAGARPALRASSSSRARRLSS